MEGAVAHETRPHATAPHVIDLAGAADRVGDVGEGRFGVGAQRANRHQADDNNQSQHHRVFDRGGAIFRREETLHSFRDVHHRNLSDC